VKSVFHTFLAFTTLGIGLVGMSYFSRPSQRKPVKKRVSQEECENEEAITLSNRGLGPGSNPSSLRESESDLTLQSIELDSLLERSIEGVPASNDPVFFLGGRISLSKRQTGILAAVANGLWGGMNLVPMHYAKRKGFGGASYLVSYAVGSMIVNSLMIFLLFLYLVVRERGRVRVAVASLPDFHLKELWLPGLLSGAIYSVAIFGTILSVTYLGQAVGYSLTQSKLLVSGMWGILFFREVRGKRAIIMWVLSACTTLCGILWLAEQKA
jgi:hypothetical protein